MVSAFACVAWLALAAPGLAADGQTSVASAGASNPDAPWIRYRLGHGETIDDLAERYGLTTDEIVAANEGRREFHKGDLVRLQPRRFSPPLASRTIRSSKRRTWDEIAARYDVEVADLRRWNKRFARRKSLPEGATLKVWFPSGVTKFAHGAALQPLPDFEAKPGAFSVGKPNRGRIEHAVQLPESPLYTIRFNRLAWGSSLTVRNVQRALAGFRRDSGFEGEIFIGAMSQKSGRRLRPHRSHQSGRDIDVRLPAMPHVTGYKLDRTEVDWHATWMMVDAFVRTDEVQVIFLERKLRARLRSAGLRMGATDERIEAVMGKIRHSKGHTSHVHVRFNCSADAPKCHQVD
ncbi:MAG: penicillin-insensitive murein endopeptidase [Myxococcota bacterium]